MKEFDMANGGNLPQHKRLAMGKGLKAGGSVPMNAGKPKMLKTGIPDSPMETAKRNNGIPGLKGGGCVK
jgi:hypothetical protein